MRLQAIALAAEALAKVEGPADLGKPEDRDRLWNFIQMAGLVGPEAGIDAEKEKAYVYGVKDYPQFIADCIFLKSELLREEGRLSLKELAKLLNTNYSKVLKRWRRWVEENEVDEAKFRDKSYHKIVPPREFVRWLIDDVFSDRYIEYRNGIEHVIEGWEVVQVRKDGKKIWEKES